MDKKQPITYYILFPKDTEEDCMKDCNQLGTVEPKKKYIDGKFTFYNEFIFRKNDGFDILQKVIEKRPQHIDKVRIINSNGRHLTVDQFLDKLDDISAII